MSNFILILIAIFLGFIVYFLNKIYTYLRQRETRNFSQYPIFSFEMISEAKKERQKYAEKNKEFLEGSADKNITGSDERNEAIANHLISDFRYKLMIQLNSDVINGNKTIFEAIEEFDTKALSMLFLMPKTCETMEKIANTIDKYKSEHSK